MNLKPSIVGDVLALFLTGLISSMGSAVAADLDFQALQALIEHDRIDSIESLLGGCPRICGRAMSWCFQAGVFSKPAFAIRASSCTDRTLISC